MVTRHEELSLVFVHIRTNSATNVVALSPRKARRLPPAEVAVHHRAATIATVTKDLVYHLEKMSGVALKVVENAKVGACPEDVEPELLDAAKNLSLPVVN